MGIQALVFKFHMDSLWCHPCLPVFSFCPLTLLFSISMHTIAHIATLTNFLYYSCKTVFISVEVSKLQDGVAIPAYTMGECGPHSFQWQLLCKSNSTCSFTSMSKISLELWAWTFGCWIFTATVLPSCSTALCTWASDAAPKGVSSKLTKSSSICWEKRKRHQPEVPQTILRKALPTGHRQHVPKLGRLSPFIFPLSPAWALSLLGLPVKHAKHRRALEILLLMETCGRAPAAHFI